MTPLSTAPPDDRKLMTDCPCALRTGARAAVTFTWIVQAPVFHVNGDDPEACYRVGVLAMAYRAQFKADVVIDMVCYRKHGHNEMDDPTFTQPVMYQRIALHVPAARQYAAFHRAQRLQPARPDQIGGFGVVRNRYGDSACAIMR